jgi:(E)-4-hydroxy-3-methylbut-2-enyl-diphosphate synthase
MWKEGITNLTHDDAALESTIGRIRNLAALGCDIVRFAVPDETSADALVRIAALSPMPVVADIHFDWRLALRCLAPSSRVAKVRINPGNIGPVERVREVVAAARDRGAAIRIGVNRGSLPKDLAERLAAQTISPAEALVEAALREAAVLDDCGFANVVVSLKASGVAETIEANRLFAAKSDIPLHLGVTEAGPLIGGVVKSTLALSALLNEGIGATIRVSLSSSPENEVLAGRSILAECGKRSGGVNLVSCPRCGRQGFDVHAFVAKWESRLYALPLPPDSPGITVAIMGCPVNGPGEARHADLGITGSGDHAVLFRHGEVVRQVPLKDADAAFEAELAYLSSTQVAPEPPSLMPG